VSQTADPTTSPSSDATLVDDYDVAQYQIGELMLDAGIFYAYAVDRCLRFVFPGSAALNTFEQSAFRKTFFADVVAPIQASFELIPGSLSQITAESGTYFSHDGGGQL
jgi:hypothetical protein